MLVAVTRAVSPSIGACELTYMDRYRIDVAKAMREHEAYRALLHELVGQAVELEADESTPDSCFVEDNAVVVDEIAVLSNMGTGSRSPEVDRIAPVLEGFREVVRIESPGTLEGGDVFQVGRTIFVGQSTRTNESGAAQLAGHLEPLGYTVVTVATRGCLHLTTGASHVGDGAVLCNPDWVDASRFAQSADVTSVWRVPEDEPWAGNALLISETLVMHKGFVRTIALLEESGKTVRAIDIEELAKAEAGLTCMSLIFQKEPIVASIGSPRVAH